MDQDKLKNKNNNNNINKIKSNKNNKFKKEFLNVEDVEKLMTM